MLSVHIGGFDKNNDIKATINIKDNLVTIMRFNNSDYIYLTDIARYKNPDNPGDGIIKRMSNKSSYNFIHYGKSY